MFPAITTEEEFEALRKTPEPWLPAIRAICAAHGLSGELRLFDQGSCVLFAVGSRWVIKLFEPWTIEHYHTERAVMAHLEGALPVPTPVLVAADLLDGWGAIVMTRLEGRAMNIAWADIPPPDRLRLNREVGALAAALHALPTTGLESLRPAWAAFIDSQRAACVERHRGHGLAPPLLSEIESLIQDVEPPPASSTLLHTELTGHNLLVARRGASWTLTGLIDFEPGMLGAPEYDLVGMSIFVGRGQPRLLRAALSAYGVADDRIDANLQRTLMALTLLHRYSRLGFFWGQVSRDPMPSSLTDLARGFFPIG